MKLAFDFFKCAFVCLFVCLASVPAAVTISVVSASQAEAARVQNISVRGNKRMEDQTVISYLTIKPGQNFNQDDIDASVKSLFATGLFSDVSIYRSGGTLIVEVVENQTINKVFFEGNTRLKDPVLQSAVQTRARGIYSEQSVQADVATIKSAYSRVGRDDAQVTYEIVPLENERVNVIFRINEGDKTKIRSISFIGNESVNDARLKDLIATKETNFLSFLGNSDIYDPNRLNADQEIIRRYYFNRGYADFQIVSTSADLDAAANEYDITITMEEGPRYSFGEINIDSTVAGVNADELYPLLDTVSGEYYSAKRVEDTIIALSERTSELGFPFAEVTPRGDRNFDSNTINVTYLIDQGPRVFIEDIKILGNDRTRDYVIRREFDLAEGDAFNQVLIQKAKRRLERLDFFDRVDITSRPGSSPDRVVVVVRLIEKSTGEFSIGGGYSSSDGPIAELSFSEKNFLGRGQFISFKAGTGSNDTEYGFSFREPYFLGTRISAGFGVNITESESQSNRLYSVDTIAGNVNFGIPLTEKLNASVFYEFNSSDIEISETRLDRPPGVPRSTDLRAFEDDGIQGNDEDELSAALAPFEGDWLKSGIGYGFTYTDFDNIADPRNGWRAQFSQTVYGAGGDANYVKTEASALAYVELSEEYDLVSFFRVRGGMINHFGSDDFRTQDNFNASSKSVRGFRSRGIGPRDPITDDALGGQAYYNATAEVQFPMPFVPNSFGFRGAFFADAGSVLNLDQDSIDRVKDANATRNGGLGLTEDQIDQLESDSIRASVGASVIWSSPFGPLRFDYAVPIAQEDYDNTREFSFGISSKF